MHRRSFALPPRSSATRFKRESSAGVTKGRPSSITPSGIVDRTSPRSSSSAEILMLWPPRLNLLDACCFTCSQVVHDLNRFRGQFGPYKDAQLRLRSVEYINASPIHNLGDGGRYIATMCPKRKTFSHFWSMVPNLTSSARPAPYTH